MERIGIGSVEPDWGDTDLLSRLKRKPHSADHFERGSHACSTKSVLLSKN